MSVGSDIFSTVALEMSAPLPLRFYNPVKDLCAKVNLDYETVIGTGLSANMREAFINAEIEKPIEQIQKEDKEEIKKIKEFYNTKYGTISTNYHIDTGKSRYDMPLTVEQDQIATIKEEFKEGNFIISGTSTKHTMKWIPGKGVIHQ
jgi:hypothetical protein